MVLARLPASSSLLGALALAVAASSASAQRAERGRLYELVVLDPPGLTTAAGVNRTGRVAGVVTDGAGSTGFVWSAAAGLVPLAPLAGTSRSVGSRINREGWVVGTSFHASVTLATLWSPSGTALEIPTTGTLSVPNAISDSGVVVGMARVGSQWEYWVWHAVHGTRALDTLGLPPGGTAMDVNAALQVCGGVPFGEAFVLDLGTSAVTWLGTLGGDWSSALRLSDRGHVVGTAGDPVSNASTPFVWTADAGMRSLGTPDGPGFAAARPHGVNDRGTVVGTLEVPLNGTHAFVWDEVWGMRDLNDVVRARGAVELTEALDVSDTGWIVGKARDASGGSPVSVGFVLKPL
jgi:probable HAF family extracellular repeat protein